MKKFDCVVVCGEELVSLEVGQFIKVVAVKLEPKVLKSSVDKLCKEVTPKRVVVTSAVDDMLNKDMKTKLNKLCAKNFHTVDALDFTTI